MLALCFRCGKKIEKHQAFTYYFRSSHCRETRGETQNDRKEYLKDDPHFKTGY